MIVISVPHESPGNLQSKEEWLLETLVTYAPDDDFSQTGIFEYWHSKTSEYRDLARLECVNNCMLALHLEEG